MGLMGLLGNKTWAQSDTTQAVKQSNNKTIKLYGFVRNYLTFDSRKTYTVIGDEYNMIPFDEKWNEDQSEDLNAVPSLRLQALTSRFGINVSGPSFRGWQSSGKIEGDFGGFGTNNTVLRLRLAYVRFDKHTVSSSQKTTHRYLLIGQDWHPLSGDIMPEVLGMAAGAPFRPHSRTPQIRGSIYWNNWGYTAALLWQLQYMNNGPKSPADPSSVASTEFAHNAIWPEAYIDFGFQNKEMILKLGVDAQVLKPRTHAMVGGVTKKVDETVSSITPTLYFRYQKGNYDIQFRTMLAQNTSHLNQLCGYAVTGVNADGSWDYAPIRNSISYLNIAYGKTVRANIFIGYMRNLGAKEDLWLDPTTNPAGGYHIYMKGGEEFTHLNSFYRIAPSISYNVKAFNFGIEYELTAATYGEIDADGSIINNSNLHSVVNHRICALAKYNF